MFLLAYVNCLIGFDMDPDAFMQSATAMLVDIPAKIYKCTLQVPHIASLGWIFSTHENIDIKDLKQLLQDVAAQLAPHQSLPVQYGLNFRPIWDGSSRAECEKDKSHNKWAIHVDAIVEIALTSKALLKKALASSWIHSYTNVPLLLVPILTKKTPNSEADDIKCAITQHCTVIQSMSKSFSTKILLLNRPLPVLLMQLCILPLWPSLIWLERNYFFWWTTTGMGKVLFSPTQHCMPHRQMIMLNTSWHTWPTHIVRRYIVGLLLMQFWRLRQWDGIQKNSNPSPRTVLIFAP